MHVDMQHFYSTSACFQARCSWLQGIWFLVINQLIIHAVFLPQAQLKLVIQNWPQEKKELFMFLVHRIKPW